jgi:hypothetical protein
VPHALEPGRRYWVHVSWLMLSIGLCLVGFWAFLSYRHVEFTLPRFIAVLSSPALIYMYSSLVSPADPSLVESWREHFFRVRIALFGTGVLLMGQVLLNNYLFLGLSPLSIDALSTLALFLVFAIGLISANPQLHSILALAPPVLLVITVLVVSEPGSLAPPLK